MAESKPQSYANHAMLDIAYHVVLLTLLLAGLIVAAVLMYRDPGLMTAWVLIAQVAMVITAIKLRTWALKLQDRIIRAEERLRLERVLPEGIRARIGELSMDQLIGTRFASDGEVAGIVEKALTNKWTRKEIKQAVQNWRADDYRV